MSRQTGSYIVVDNEIISKRRPNGDILLVRLDDSEFYFTINGIAANAWQKLYDGESVESVEAQIAEENPKNKKEIKDLMEKFIKDLVKQKIMTLETVK